MGQAGYERMVDSKLVGFIERIHLNVFNPYAFCIILTQCTQLVKLIHGEIIKWIAQEATTEDVAVNESSLKPDVRHGHHKYELFFPILISLYVISAGNVLEIGCQLTNAK